MIMITSLGLPTAFNNSYATLVAVIQLSHRSNICLKDSSLTRGKVNVNYWRVHGFTSVA